MPRGSGLANISPERRKEIIKKAQEARKANKELRKEGKIIEKTKDISPMKRIKLKCLDCCNESHLEVKLCTVKGCWLWPVRRGKRRIKGIIDDSQRASITEKDSSELTIDEDDIALDEKEKKNILNDFLKE